MLKTTLLHPEILMALGSNGHGAKILIADGNYPISTCSATLAKKVFLNLAPGMLNVIDVLKVLEQFIPIEKAYSMQTPDGSAQPIHQEFKKIIKEDILEGLEKPDFYDLAKSADVCLAIATGETRRFANIILQIGVMKYE